MTGDEARARLGGTLAECNTPAEWLAYANAGLDNARKGVRRARMALTKAEDIFVEAREIVLALIPASDKEREQLREGK